jgi:hypothetical protein
VPDYDNIIGIAISAAVKVREPAYANSWNLLKPDKEPLNLSNLSAYRGFVGDITSSVATQIGNCTVGGSSDFDEYQSKALYLLRAAIKASIKSPEPVGGST